MKGRFGLAVSSLLPRFLLRVLSHRLCAVCHGEARLRSVHVQLCVLPGLLVVLHGPDSQRVKDAGCGEGDAHVVGAEVPWYSALLFLSHLVLLTVCRLAYPSDVTDQNGAWQWLKDVLVPLPDSVRKVAFTTGSYVLSKLATFFPAGRFFTLFCSVFAGAPAAIQAIHFERSRM